MKTQDFKQTMRVGVEGSFQNQLIGNNNTIPVVGEYATHLMYSDRRPYKVLYVSDCKTKAILQHIDVTVKDGVQVFNDTESTIHIEYRNNAWYTISNTIIIDRKFVKDMELTHKKMYSYYLLTEEQKKSIYFNAETGENCVWPCNIIKGLTKAKKVYDKISLLFTSAPDYYYDPHF